MAEYTETQKAFVFSMISSSTANREGTVPELEKLVVDKFEAVTNGYPQYLGARWSLEWGPVVYQAPDSKVADNTVFVAKGVGTGRALYVVSVAGTNPKSMFDRDVDFDVFVQVPFGEDKNVLIARGTHRDVAIIEGLTSNGKTLQQYLELLPDKGAALVFAGHSLGGAIAPALILDLVVNRKFSLVRPERFFVCPTAGPTPGNQAFSDLYASVFHREKGSNENVVNAYDAVPHAWAELERIKRVYLPHIHSLCIDTLVNALILKFKELPVQVHYSNLPKNVFPGAYDPNQVPVKFPQSHPVRFAVQALHQHINAYIHELVPELRAVLDISPLSAEAEQGIEDACSRKGMA
jgi:hypothetical protein